LKRILSAVVFLPFFFVIVYYGSPRAFFIFLSIAVLIGLIEFYSMIENSGRECYKFLGVPLGWLLVLTIYIEKNHFTILFFTFTILLILIYRLFQKEDFTKAIEGISHTLFGVFYVGLLMSYLLLLRNLQEGYKYIFLLFLITWMGDTVAYYTGMSIGNKKLYPKISGNKTIEGSLGGLIGSIGGAFIAKLWFFSNLRLLDCLVLGILLGVFGQLGDLCESLLKRSSAIKDSGKIIPGHGGILDRVDSILFSAPLLYYYFIFLW